MRIDLSAKFVEAVKCSGARVEYYDARVPGFRLRVSETGAKSWVLFYRVRGISRLRRLTIGAYPAFSLSEARKAAENAKKLAGKGIDPFEQRANDRAEMVDQQSNTVGLVFQRFLAEYARKHTREKTWKETKRIFEADVLPSLRNEPVSKVTRRDIIALVDKIVKRGSSTMGNRTLAAVRKFFNWCVEKDLVQTSPAIGAKAPSKERSRDRVLTDEELRFLWKSSDALGWPFGPYFQILLLTAQRRGEVANMRWVDLDKDKKTWILRKEFTKAGREHMVPLGPKAQSILNGIKRVGKSELVFTTTGKTPISGLSKAKIDLDPDSALSDWRFHDFRRTAASTMAKLKVPPHVIEKVLNHTTGQISGVAAVYNRHGYEDEKRDALQAWEDYVFRILAIKKS